MEKNEIEALIVEYLRGDMTPQQKSDIKEILRQNGYALSDLAELEELWSRLPATVRKSLLDLARASCVPADPPLASFVLFFSFLLFRFSPP